MPALDRDFANLVWLFAEQLEPTERAPTGIRIAQANISGCRLAM